MGKLAWGGDKLGGSSSPGTGSQSPTVTSKMGTTGGSLREMLKMPEYHNPDPLVRLIGEANEAPAIVEGTGGGAVPYHGYVECHLQLPEIKKFDVDVLMLVIDDSAYGMHVPIQI